MLGPVTNENKDGDLVFHSIQYFCLPPHDHSPRDSNDDGNAKTVTSAQGKLD